MGIREAMLLRHARTIVQAYGSARLDEIRAHKREASARLRSSRRLSDAHAAAVLLVNARAFAARATAAAGREPRPVLAVDVDALGFADAEALRDRLELEVGADLAAIESRTPTELRGLEIGRFAAVVVAIWALLWSVTAPWRLHDVALGKPVKTSPLLPPPATPEGIVDGRTRGTYGLQTAVSPAPFVTIDL